MGMPSASAAAQTSLDTQSLAGILDSTYAHDTQVSCCEGPVKLIQGGHCEVASGHLVSDEL